MLLRSIPGIGGIVARGILCELADLRRFNNVKQLTGYVGLVPRVHQSGGNQTWGMDFVTYVLITCVMSSNLQNGSINVRPLQNIFVMHSIIKNLSSWFALKKTF